MSINAASRTIRTTITTTTSAVVELIATGNIVVKEVGITLVAATASVFALGRPAAIGVTPTSPVFLLRPNNAPALHSKLAVAWATPPTVPAAFFRQGGMPATVGAQMTWSNLNITVPTGGSLILWTLSVVSLADVYFTVEENLY